MQNLNSNAAGTNVNECGRKTLMFPVGWEPWTVRYQWYRCLELRAWPLKHKQKGKKARKSSVPPHTV